MTVGEADPAKRELEARGRGGEHLRADRDQVQQLRGAGGRPLQAALQCVIRCGSGRARATKWWIPNLDDVSAGPPRRAGDDLCRDAARGCCAGSAASTSTPEPAVQELDVWLLAGETIRPDAARLFRSRPPATTAIRSRRRTASPGVAFRWLEVEGPLYDEWPTAGHRLLFGDLPLKPPTGRRGASKWCRAIRAQDAERLLRSFVRRAYRRPVAETRRCSASCRSSRAR